MRAVDQRGASSAMGMKLIDLFGGQIGEASLGVLSAPETDVVMPGGRTP